MFSIQGNHIYKQSLVETVFSCLISFGSHPYCDIDFLDKELNPKTQGVCRLVDELGNIPT